MRAQVKMDRVYRSQTAANREVPADERMKGFKYGTQLVPFGPADEAAMKYTCDRCLKTIAFIDRSKARRTCGCEYSTVFGLHAACHWPRLIHGVACRPSLHGSGGCHRGSAR